LIRLTNDLTDYAGVSLTADRTSVVTARIDRRVGVWLADAVGRNAEDGRDVCRGKGPKGAARVYARGSTCLSDPGLFGFGET
jgi:hypothetical protein